MKNEFTLKEKFSVLPKVLYDAWLDPKIHSEMTESIATMSAQKVGSQYTAWDGYIEGTNLELESNKRIVQSWRSTDFTSDTPDSVLELTFEKNGDGTLLVLHHKNIPEGQVSELKQGWRDFYFKPMHLYFKDQYKKYFSLLDANGF